MWFKKDGLKKTLLVAVLKNNFKKYMFG